MQVKVVGGHGGVTPENAASSYLVDEKLLIDAGSVATGLSLQGQCALETILISHSHLDHIKDLAFLCDNCFGMRGGRGPFEVFCHKDVKKAILKHLMNDVIWPDFSVLPNKQNPTINFNEIKSEKSFERGHYRITPVHVNHPGPALGYIIEKPIEKAAILFTMDTAGTDRIWQVAKEIPHLKAIFTEVSFPNELKGVAKASDHHCPMTLAEELKKMPSAIPIYLGHLKPAYQEQLIQQVKALKDPRIHLLEKDGAQFDF